MQLHLLIGPLIISEEDASERKGSILRREIRQQKKKPGDVKIGPYRSVCVN